MNQLAPDDVLELLDDTLARPLGPEQLLLPSLTPRHLSALETAGVHLQIWQALPNGEPPRGPITAFDYLQEPRQLVARAAGGGPAEPEPSCRFVIRWPREPIPIYAARVIRLRDRVANDLWTEISLKSAFGEYLAALLGTSTGEELARALDPPGS
jgi:hypothetical protein